MPTALDPSQRELAKQLFVQGLSLAVIAGRTGVNVNTLSTWCKRGRWTDLRSQTCEALAQTGQKLASTSIAEASDNVRGLLSVELQNQASLLAKNPPSGVEDLGNCPARQGRAGIVKSLADSAKIVFDWADSQPTGLVAIGLVELVETCGNQGLVAPELASGGDFDNVGCMDTHRNP